MLFSDYDSGSLLFAFLLYDMTWSINRMPHDNIAVICLATLRNYVLGKDPGKLSYAIEIVICAICLNLG